MESNRNVTWSSAHECCVSKLKGLKYLVQHLQD